MSLSDNYVPVKVSGNGVSDEFSGSWNVLNASFIRVYWEDKTTGVQTLKVLDTDYTLEFDASGFTVTFEPTAIPASTVWVVIGREIARTQAVPFKTSTGFNGTVQENSFDKITGIAQELQEQIDRSPKVPLGSSISFNFPTPEPLAALVWNEDGDAIINGPTTTDIAGAATAAATATAAAAAAAIDAAEAEQAAIDAVAAVGAVKISVNDTTAATLGTKLVAGTGIILTELNDGGNETLRISGNSLTLGTPQTTTSGTSFTFGSIPSGTKQIDIMFQGVSLSGTDNIIIQLGDAGGIETSGYISTSCNLISGSAVGVSGDTTGFLARLLDDGLTVTGQMTLTLLDAATFTWVATHTFKGSSGQVIIGAGQKSLSAELTQLKILTTGANTFDAGIINIQYI